MIDIPEDELEIKVARLSELSYELGLFLPVVRYRVMSILDGKVSDSRCGISRSWNRNAYNWIASQVQASPITSGTFGAGVLNIKDTGGTTRTTSQVLSLYYANASAETSLGYTGPINNDTRGIVVGTGTGAESFNDYKLGTKILSGVTAGTLSYQASASPATSYNAGSREFTVTWSRYFNNNTAGSINVGEIGIYSVMVSSWIMMVCRDLINPAIEVLPSASLYVEYTIILVYQG